MPKFSKIDPETKRLWVEALRSGKYQQGHCGLRTTEDKFCCLGVLCDIKDVPALILSSDYYTYNFDGQTSKSSIPVALRKIIGLGIATENSLITMNDIEGKSFNQIADWIEENL